MSELSSRDYSDLKEPEARIAYYDSVLDWRVTKTDAEALGDLKDYIGYLEQGLEAIGLDEAEAMRTAADTVFCGLAKYVHDHGNTGDTTRLDHIDKLLRREHDIDERVFPIHHEDPLVASYYTSLGQHLLTRMPGDRTDGFGGYDPA